MAGYADQEAFRAIEAMVQRPAVQSVQELRYRDIVWIEALDHFWVPIGTTGVLGKPKMKYMHQVRSLSTKKGGGARSVLQSRVVTPGEGCILIRNRDIGRGLRQWRGTDIKVTKTCLDSSSY